MANNTSGHLDRNKIYITFLCVIISCVPLFVYVYLINLTLNKYGILSVGFNDALISMLQGIFFAFFGAIYATWRRFTKLKEYIFLGTAAFLPTMIIALTLPTGFNYSIRGFEFNDSSSSVIFVIKNAPGVYVTVISYWLILFKSPLLPLLGQNWNYQDQGHAYHERLLSIHEEYGPLKIEIERSLRIQSLEQSFLSIILSLNVAILTVLVLIIANISVNKAFLFCIIITFSSIVSLIIRIILLNRESIDTLTEYGIITISIIMASSWGALSFFVIEKDNIHIYNLLLSLLACGGFVMVTLSSQRLLAMILSDIFLFIPFIFLVLYYMPDKWEIYLSGSIFCIIAVMGFGFAVYKRNERQVFLKIKIDKANNEINQKSLQLHKALSDIERVNEKIKQEYRYREKLLRALGHDLRQPINALNLFLYQLSKIKIPESASDIVNMCRDCAHSAGQIIESLSQMAWLTGQITPKSDQPIILTSLFLRLCKEFHTEATVKGIRLRSVPCSLRVASDERLVERILRNYLSNAVRHTDQGGILLGARRRRSRVEVLCLDTGPGIPIEEQERIFDEFYQARDGFQQASGMLGMGLAIVKELAALIDADVVVRSIVGKGSTFGIILTTYLDHPETKQKENINPQQKDLSIETNSSD